MIVASYVVVLVASNPNALKNSSKSSLKYLVRVARNLMYSFVYVVVGVYVLTRLW